MASDAMRFTALAGLFLAVVIASRFFGAAGQSVMKTVLAVSIIFQTVWGAADYLEGPQTRQFQVPYETNEFVLGTADEFLPPPSMLVPRPSSSLDHEPRPSDSP